MIADQMIQLGAVRWLRRIVGLHLSIDLYHQRDLRMTIRWDDGYIQRSTSTFVSLLKSERPVGEEHRLWHQLASRRNRLAYLFRPFDSRESSSCLVPSLDPDSKRVFTSGDLICQFWNQEVLELGIRTCT